MNQLVTITMIGQWKDGIPLHLRNMKWALSSFNHESYVVTTQEIKQEYESQFPNVKFLAHTQKPTGSFINFWEEFPKIVKNHNIQAEYFLLMEQDIWFHSKITSLPSKEKDIINYLPMSKYHALTVNGVLVHHRVWEGANLFHHNLIQGAIRDKISFSFTKKYFFEEQRAEWEDRLGGKIGMSEFKIPDTMDEMTYYCPMKHNTTAVFEDKAVHIRGPETIHRSFPNLYQSMSMEEMAEVRKKYPYLDVQVGIAGFYLSGNYSSIESFDMKKMKTENKAMFTKLLAHAQEWMSEQEYTRLRIISASV